MHQELAGISLVFRRVPTLLNTYTAVAGNEFRLVEVKITGIGNSVLLLRRARFGGPLHVRVGSTELMLRVREAGCIRITNDDPADASVPSR